MAAKQYDLAIAGGGLAGGLTALALNKLRPDLKVALIEADDHFGGNHIWSFFDSDIEPEHRWLIDPLISQHWDSYDVHFPKYSRTLQTGYNSITSEKFDHIICEKLDSKNLLTNSKIKKLENNSVQLEHGAEINASTILDARGGGDLSALEYGWQKFCGQLLTLKNPHGLERPIIKDATVEQIDGYRFVYCLPFSNTEVFVEDTYYSDGPEIDEAACHQRIAEYAAAKGWDVAEVSRSESGQLPVFYGGDFDAFWDSDDDIEARIGARAALIHPVTSYSLPMAVKTAIMIAGMPDLNQRTLNKFLFEYAANHWKRDKFYRMLCAMMFKAAKPEKRYLPLAHTYTKDQALIERFYAGKTNMLDKAKLLTGRPPVPISKALPIMMKYL